MTGLGVSTFVTGATLSCKPPVCLLRGTVDSTVISVVSSRRQSSTTRKQTHHDRRMQSVGKRTSRRLAELLATTQIVLTAPPLERRPLVPFFTPAGPSGSNLCKYRSLNHRTVKSVPWTLDLSIRSYNI